MKIGMNMLLWTGHVTEEHACHILQAIKDDWISMVSKSRYSIPNRANALPRSLVTLLDDLSG